MWAFKREMDDDDRDDDDDVDAEALNVLWSSVQLK